MSLFQFNSQALFNTKHYLTCYNFLFYISRGVVIKKKWVDTIRSWWMPYVCKVTNVHKKYKMAHFTKKTTCVNLCPRPTTPLYISVNLSATNKECKLYFLSIYISMEFI